MEFAQISVGEIIISKEQPRKNFNQERLEELANSIEEVGQLQPIIVKKQQDRYCLIAGERRFRAIKQNTEADEITAIIMDENLDDYSLHQIQLIENLQRQDLDPLERAISIQKFIDENSLTKKDASKKLGVPRTTLTEWLNILEVNPFYRQAVLDEDSSLTLSHVSLAKALANRTGDPCKLNNLLDGIIKFNLTRSETKEVVNLFHKYLHMSMEEAIDTVLIKREQKRISAEKKGSQKKAGNSVKRLLKLFDTISKNLEEVMEEQPELEESERENVIDQFIYIYQLLEIMVPEFKNHSLDELKKQIKEKAL